jgi:S1-C subfamily serine protease
MPTNRALSSRSQQALVWLAAGGVFIIVFLAASGLLNVKAKPSQATEAPLAQVAPAPPPTNDSRTALAPDALFARCSPAVVLVETRDEQDRDLGIGSGFVVDENDLVATNYHVVADAHKVHVVLADKHMVEVAGVAAFNQSVDLAILKLSRGVEVSPLPLASAELPAVGSRVYAIGNPRGLTLTLSDGLVSAHREDQGIKRIQTSAPISPGSSGGPLLNADAKVVGVTSSGRIDGQNLNFAVPVQYVDRLLLRSAELGKLTPFPLVSRRPTTTPPSGGQQTAWSKDDVENAVHFVRALHFSDEAWQICIRAGHAGRPFMLDEAGRKMIGRLMDDAHQEAKQVRKGVLKQIHEGLPDAFEDFVASTWHIGPNTVARRPDSRVQATWARWKEWRRLHEGEWRVPKGVSP